MMKRAINSYMLRAWELEKVLQLCVKCNIGNIGLCMDHIKDVAYTKQLLKRYNMHVISLYVLFVSTDAPQIVAEEKEHIEKIFEKAKMIQATYVTIIFKYSEYDKGYANLLSISKELTEISRNTGVKILIEPMHICCRLFSAVCTFNEIVYLNKNLDAATFFWAFDICHIGDKNIWNSFPKDLMSKVVSIHLANLEENNPDERCFPSNGRFDYLGIMKLLVEKDFSGFLELEVISPEISVMKETEIQMEILHVFPLKILVIGELALHEFVPVEKEPYTLVEDTRQLGGGAAMILRQLDKLDINATSMTITGDDKIGKELGTWVKTYSRENIHVYQKDAKTSRVKLMIDKTGCRDMEISGGTVEPSQLQQLWNEIENFEGICYCPYFPGYEKIVERLSRDEKKKIILDIGFNEWCGNVEQILLQLKKAPEEVFLVLINGKNMSAIQKERIKTYCKGKKYSQFILTDGTNAVWGYDGDCDFVFLPEVVEEICACGAGDVTIAGVMAKLAQGVRLKEALIFGAGLSKEKVQKLGV